MTAIEKAKELKPCPFCGGEATYEYDGARIGTHNRSCIVVCTDCGCRLESNEIGKGVAWNTRASLEAEKPASPFVPRSFEDEAERYHQKRCSECKEASGSNLISGHFTTDYAACPYCGAHPFIRESATINPNMAGSAYRAVCSECKK